MAELRPKYAAAAHQRAQLNPADHIYEDQCLAFRAVAGSRLKRMTTMIGAPLILYKLRLIMVVGEACRAISYYFQQCSEGRLRLNLPNMCDLSMPWTSPLVACTQFLSALLFGSTSTSRMIWQYWGHNSMREWAVALPEETE